MTPLPNADAAFRSELRHALTAEENNRLWNMLVDSFEDTGRLINYLQNTLGFRGYDESVSLVSHTRNEILTTRVDLTLAYAYTA